MAAKPKFTRIPKIPDLVTKGVPTEAIPTYCALADYAHNKSGLCWPKMETLAAILKRSVRTIQRHLHLLRKLGLIEFVFRRRHKGRFSSYTYKILHIATTGHRGRLDKRVPNIRRTKQYLNTHKSPVTEDYEWLFGDPESPESKKEHKTDAETKRREAANRRTDGYEWLFS